MRRVHRLEREVQVARPRIPEQGARAAVRSVVSRAVIYQAQVLFMAGALVLAVLAAIKQELVLVQTELIVPGTTRVIASTE